MKEILDFVATKNTKETLANIINDVLSRSIKLEVFILISAERLSETGHKFI